ncbi:TPA: LPXTG cell wall anchor domain-containing protein [Streptococcus pneumoniae]|nr:LPXTG cell wall anchor domain-containing protein [Streptococcus pneumoniae]HEU1774438.1 LPXTG cell wall anchor domain-containing protein [Streptococcus pneumoniae]HEU1800237.1 LPXTG cell wall anchor domain-containing protein [Streptococcus pneumoniae]HEU1808103.1 LPXTG cell wall anchor domain-containing protein [Streptococcus pneumoniae]HEU1846251.1 LPXTG cell wall anchor domain-containing protein [Streptococcus pneumoniae]
MHDLLGRLSLTEGEKEKYRNQIDTATELDKLVELEGTLDNLQNKEIEEAVEKAKVTLPQYMDTRLKELDQTGSGFPDLLKKLQNIIDEYREQLDGLPNKKAVEDLVEQAKEEMDGYIAEYQKTLTAGQDDNNGAGEQAPQAGDNNGAGEQVPQAPQAGDNNGAGEQVPQAPQAPQAGDNNGAGEQAPQAPQAPQAGDNNGAGEQAPQAPQAGDNNGAGEQVPQAPQAPQAGDNNGAGEQVPQAPQAPQAGDQTFTGTVGSVNVTVLFDKPVNAEKVTVKEITEKDLVDKISRQAGGGSIRLFDLSLTKDGKETHVNEERTVRLALEGLGENVQVYHVKPDGQLELLDSKVEDGHVIFRINHFSLFAIKTMSTKSNQETPSNQATPSTQAKSTPKETTKDATSKKTLPNTGTADSTALLAAAASTAILGLGLAGRRRKED